MTDNYALCTCGHYRMQHTMPDGSCTVCLVGVQDGGKPCWGFRAQPITREDIELAGVGKIQDKAKDSPASKVHAYESSKKGIPKMSESELQGIVIALAHTLGYLAHAERPARVMVHGKETWRTAVQGDAGFPDVAIVGHKRFIMAELKSDIGHASEAQWEWTKALDAAEVECYLWRPKDWLDGTIEKVLKG